MFSQIINDSCLGHLAFAGCPKVTVLFNHFYEFPIEISEQRTKRSIASTVVKTDRRSFSQMNVNGPDFFLYAHPPSLLLRFFMWAVTVNSFQHFQKILFQMLPDSFRKFYVHLY